MTNETATSLRAAAATETRLAQESFDRCDTDGCLTQWAHGITAQLRNAQAALIDAGGVSQFRGLYHGDRRIPAKLVTTYFNHVGRGQWQLRADAAEEFGRHYVPLSPARGGVSRIQKALGLSERYEMAPAVAKIMGGGYGLAGAASAQVGRERAGCPWGTDAKPVEGGAA